MMKTPQKNSQCFMRRAFCFIFIVSLTLIVWEQSFAQGLKKNQVASSYSLEPALKNQVELHKHQDFSLPSSGVQIQKWCEEVKSGIARFQWKLDPCGKIQWRIGGQSVQGRALVYADFGDPGSENKTLVFSTVHGDEVTPLYLGIQLALWLESRQKQLLNTRVIIAPLVNPDGFFKQPKARMNARGVDINRNFPTQDWVNTALSTWKKKFRSDPRRFPGNSPGSEPETIFQEELIRLIQPQKILSIHSPLNFLDYDGPNPLALSRFPKDYAQTCERLKKSLKAISGGYFPGSLGNYAGRELGIPTLTLELPSADPKKAERYWNQFSQGIRTMIHFNVPNMASSQLDAKAGS